jgi:hypothetical protein
MAMKVNSGYNGNPLLKKSGVQINWTPEMMAEYAKCASDPIYFSEKYIKIVCVDNGLIPIKLYEFQSDLIKSSYQNRYTVACTGRQQGKTTTAVCIILHYALFNDYKRIALLANKGDSAREILDRIKIAYEALPIWLQQGVVEWNKGSVEFENGCKIIAAATSSSAIRGKSVSFLYIDETSFVENWAKFMSAVYPTISSGKSTKILLTSTPNGQNHFHKIVTNASRDHSSPDWNGYHAFLVPWWKIPNRDAEWKRETLAGMDFDEDLFAQEYECSFIGSSGTLISGKKLKELVHATPIQQQDGVTQYEIRDDNKKYALIADVSRGKGLDYSAFHVIDVSSMPYRQVMTYRLNTVSPTDYATVIYRIATIYNEAMVLVELNDIGGQVSDALYNIHEYENVLFTETDGKGGKEIAASSSSADCGIRTTKSVKALGCGLLKLLIENNQLIINDHETISELGTFTKKLTSYEAEVGKNDDLVMGLVLFAWLTSTSYFKDETDIITMSNLGDKTEDQLYSDLLPFGEVYNGLNDDEQDNIDFWASEYQDDKVLEDLWDDKNVIEVY